MINEFDTLSGRNLMFIYAVEPSTVPIVILEFDETGTIVVSGSI